MSLLHGGRLISIRKQQMLQNIARQSSGKRKTKYRVTINLSCFDATPTGGQQGRALPYFENPYHYVSR